MSTAVQGKPRHKRLYKRAEAIGYATGACGYLRMAIDSLEAAERQLKCSGYRGATLGIHQANERVKAWLDKVEAEL